MKRVGMQSLESPRMTRIAAIAIPCLLLLASCGPAYPTHPPIPPIRSEQVPVPPRSSVVLIWQPGHYNWNGNAYVWIPGEWVDRAGHGTLWQDGYWEQTAQGSVWLPAHWF